MKQIRDIGLISPAWGMLGAPVDALLKNWLRFMGKTVVAYLRLLKCGFIERGMSDRWCILDDMWSKQLECPLFYSNKVTRHGEENGHEYNRKGVDKDVLG